MRENIVAGVGSLTQRLQDCHAPHRDIAALVFTQEQRARQQ